MILKTFYSDCRREGAIYYEDASTNAKPTTIATPYDDSKYGNIDQLWEIS